MVICDARGCDKPGTNAVEYEFGDESEIAFDLCASHCAELDATEKALILALLKPESDR